MKVTVGNPESYPVQNQSHELVPIDYESILVSIVLKITYFRHEAVNNEYGEKSLKLQQQLFYWPNRFFVAVYT